MPKTRSGKWAVRCGITLVALTVASLAFAAAIGGNPDVIATSPVLSVLANAISVLFTLAGPLSFFVGVYTAIRYKEWSIWKPLAILYALTVCLFLLGEFLFPH